MTNYRRTQKPEGYYFFTVVTHNRTPFLTTPLARSILHSVWQHIQEKHPFQSLAVCLMPDHLHCIWGLPEEDSDYSTRWALIKKQFSYHWLNAGGKEAIQSHSRRKRRHRGVWQKRFWEHRIRDRRDLTRHIHYIHWDPVKHKLVENVEDWPYSSYHQHMKAGNYTLPEITELKKMWGDDLVLECE